MKCYFFNWWDSLNCTSNSRCIMNLCSWSCKYSKLIFLWVKEEIFAYKFTTGSKIDTVQLGEKTLKFVGFRRKIVIMAIFFSAWKWQPSWSVNNEILMIPAEGYKVLSIVTELTKKNVWAFNVKYRMTWNYVLVKSSGTMNLEESKIKSHWEDWRLNNDRDPTKSSN